MSTPVPVELSTYEIERNKPMPNLIHGLIQGAIVSTLNYTYGDEYMFPSELNLNTSPRSVLDVCILPLRIVNLRSVEARESEPPITTIEIQSPSQSLDILVNKTWELYFPMGVQSAWIVIPALKAIQVILPDDTRMVFLEKDTLKDPVTGIEIEVARVFKNIV